MSTDHRLRLPHASEGFGPPPLGSMGPLGLPAPVPNLSHSRLWHSSPVHPAGQRQRPVRRSQRPPWRHVQRCWQPAPKRPGGHSAGAGTGKGPTSWGGTQEPPPRPRFPHPEPRTPRPRKGEVEAPVPLQVRGHTAGQCSPPPGSRLRPQRRGLDQARWAAGLAPTDPRLPQTPSAPCSPLPAQRSPFSQARPVQPSGQVQWPETASQVPPCWQRQACRQPSPCRPSGQAGRPRGQRGAAPASQARRGPEPPWGGPARRPASDLVRRPHPGRPAPGHLGPPAQPSWALCTTSPGPGPPLGKSYIHPVSQETLQGPARGAHTPAGKWAWLTLQAAGACPARATVTLSMDWVTGGPMEAGASLAAVVPIGEGWAGCRGEARQGSGRWALGRAAADRGRWADPLGPRGLCGYSIPPSGLCVTQSGRK